MSERARAKLAAKWQTLEFYTVKSTEARQPEDVLAIELRKPPIGTYPDGSPIYNGTLRIERTAKRLADIPEDLRPHACVMWERYHGYTTSGARFDSHTYNTLDFTTDFTLEPGTWANHTMAKDHPNPGDVLCGTPEPGPDGTVLRRWFPCDEAFRLLVTSLREGPRHTEEELAHLLLTKGFPDTYFAIARLVFFDNVQAFVDGIKVGSPAPTTAQLFMGAPVTISSAAPDVARHPAYGKTYAGGWPVDWRGMFLGTGYAQQVHELSHTLDEPAWWADFLRLAAEQGVIHSHPDRGGTCHACMAADPDWYSNGFPYQFEGA